MSNSIITTNNLTSTSIPELYIRYFNPKISIDTDIIIPYYVSDSTQEEFLRNTNTKTFTTVVKIGNSTFFQTTNAGEYSINIGSISTTGETYFSIYTIDENGVASIEQFFDILIIDSSYAITSSQTYTMVESDLTKHNIVVGESVSNTVAQSNNTGLNNLFNEVKNNGYRKIIMLNRIYMLDYHGDKIIPPSEFTVDMNNATFKATQCTDINVANLVDLRDCFDTHVINGKLVGNYDGFDFATTQSTTGYNIPGEGLAVAEINGSKYSSFENMDMSYSVGYNLGVFGGKDAGYVGSPGALKFSNAYYINGNNTVNSDILSTTDLIDITGLLDRGEIQCSVYLNYGGLKLNKAELFIHFYNSSSSYMTTVKTRQYQIVKIPAGATQVRVTGFTTSSTDNSGLTICHTGYSKNCELINIKSHNTRTCAMHPGMYNHLLIKDCAFDRVADENEYKVTKLALDFEDGYENGRNLFFINNEVYEGTSALTIQRCFNANIIGCRNFGLDTRGHIKGAYIKNNFFNNGDIYTTNFDSQSHLKLINNTFLKYLNFLKWDDTGNYDSIGLTELDCKNGYTNNKNCTLFIRNQSGVTDTPSSYTITNNLTNCTSNNNSSDSLINSSYSATITPNDGYAMSSITVTMGVTDISDTAVSDNVISISSVTGNIVITAVALKQVEVVSETVLFDNGLAEGYTISNGANYTVGDKITLSHGDNTYFGFDQSVTFNAGDSISFVIDTCGSDASDYITRVCYLDDNNALQGYETTVTDDVVNANLPYTLTHTFNSTTTIKPALMKYFGNITISKVYITTTEVVIGEQPLYKFGLLSDVHVDGDGTDEAHSISDLTNAISFLENAGANFIAYTGDMTYNGRSEDYTALKTCLQASTVSNYCVRGNHDAYTLSDGYASATGCKDDYIITQNNDLLIFISCADTNHDTGGLTASKLDWLENLLQTNTNTRVFLFYHYFVEGTSGNAGGNYPWGSLNPSNAIALRFINMVKQYPNLIFCNGHSHIRFNLQDQYPNANYYHNNGECYYIHVPSGAKPRYLSGDTVADYYEGSEGYLVEVYANKVIFKPIDFISSEYLTKYNYTANVVQGNNAPSVPSVPSVPDTSSTIDITWNNGVKIDRSTGAETSDTNYSASNFIACDTSKTYTLNLASSMSSHAGNVFICYYDENKSFISCSDNYVGTYHSSPDVFSAELSFPSNAKYIKLRFYADNNGVTAIDKSIITLNVTEVATTEGLTLNYTFNNQTAGNGYGTISLLASSDDTAGTYTIQYADNNGALSNYDNICTLTVTNGVQADYTHFIKEQMIPKYATKIIAVKDNQTKAEFVIPEAKRFTSGNYGQHLYSFGAISDLHVALNTWNTDFQEALTYFNDKENIVFTCITGDITNGGKEDYFQRYKNKKDAYSPNTPVYATNGNHEWDNTSFNDTLWDTYMDNKRTCLFTQGNDVFIMLGTEKKGSAKILPSAEKQWVELQLEKYSNCRVFIFCHYFIDGTDNGNYTGWDKDSVFSTSNANGQWLLGLLQQYKNAFYVSGHSHFKFILQELNSKANVCNEYNGNEIGYLWHLASITAPKDVIDGSATSNLTAESEGVVVDVYENCILYRGRNFVDKKFLPIAQYIIPKTEGTLPDTSVYTVKTTLQNATSSNTVTSVAKNSSYTTTITATDGYSVNKITVIMGVTDISSTAVSGNTITIDSVTDDLIIKVVTINSASEVITPTWTTGNISSNGNNNDGDTSAMRTDHMTFDINSYEYYITVTNEFEGIDNIKVYFYNSDSTFNSRKALSSASVTPGVPFKIAFPSITGTFRVKADFLTTNTLENINDRLIVTKVVKETEPETPTEPTSEVITPTWKNGGIAAATGADNGDPEGMRSSYMEFDTNAYTYYITVTNEFEGIDKLRVAIYNPDGSFVVRQAYDSTSLTPGVPGAIAFPITSGKFRLKVDFKLTNTLENINNRLVITKVPK